MKITRAKISRLGDAELVAAWAQSSRNEYAGGLLLRYAPFLYGLFLRYAKSAEGARNDVNAFADGFPALLSSYYDSGDFARWLYRKAVTFVHERHPQPPAAQPEPKLLAAHRHFISNLNAEDEQAVALFEQGRDKLAKPQRECIQFFFFERQTFERIAGHAGYLTDKVRSYIEAGVVALSPGNKKPKHDATVFTAVRLHDKFVDYAGGDRDDSDAYEVELESMLDPFLSDAVGGILAVQADHGKALAELDRELEAKFLQPKKSRKWLVAVLVVLAALAVIAGVLYFISAKTPERGAEREYIEGADNEYKDGAERGGEPTADGASGETVVGPETHGEAQSKEVDADETPPAGTGRDAGAEGGTAAGDAATGDPAEETAGPVSIVSISKGDGADYVSTPKIGKRRYDDYLRRAVVMPEDGAKGDVTLTFYVNRYGRPSQIRVTEYLSQEAHREAIRLLENGPEWSETDRQVTVVMRFG